MKLQIMEPEHIDITDREADFKFTDSETWRAEVGLRAIAYMYDDHSDDKNSHDNILILKDNIKYKLFRHLINTLFSARTL